MNPSRHSTHRRLAGTHLPRGTKKALCPFRLEQARNRLLLEWARLPRLADTQFRQPQIHLSSMCVLSNYLKTLVYASGDTISVRTPIEPRRGSSALFSHISPEYLCTSRAIPMFSPLPSAGQDGVSAPMRPVSPHQSFGCVAHIRTAMQPFDPLGCHTLCPSIDAEAKVAQVAPPPQTPASPPTTWRHAH